MLSRDIIHLPKTENSNLRHEDSDLNNASPFLFSWWLVTDVQNAK